MMASPLLDFNEGPKKRFSVERIYQRKTQLEHILLRPDSYVGSVEEMTDLMWVYDEEKEGIVQRQITYVPGLYKIFDEILVNAADNKQRDDKMNAIKIRIDPENNIISVWNNGAGIPVEMHTIEKLYVPELIFGTLLTSSNFDDDEKKVTGGRNGYGAKLCNIFSTEFTVETASSSSGKQFKQTWHNNMGDAGKNTVTASKKDFTHVTFKPDLGKFKMSHLNKDIVSLMTRRAYDIAGCTKGVSVYLNGNKLPVKSFKDYVELYLKGETLDEEELPRRVVHEIVNPRWEVCVTASSNGFKQSSFVNSIATTKGGTHVQAVVTPLVNKLLEAAKKKNKGGMDLKPFHIKSHLWVFVNCLVENPTFDSQTKENMTLPAKSFGSSCQFGDKFIKSVLGCGVVERVLDWARVKSQSQLNKKQHGTKSTKLKGIAKLDDANDAGSKLSQDCTLIVTEGDSAKTLAVSGLGVVGRDKYGVFPLRGKFLNVREASYDQVMKNEEVKNVIKILGLQYGKKYATAEELKALRYGRIMVMADQDQDGSHIKGLVINFFHHNWPQLLHHGFIEEFITPIVKAVKGKQELAFFSLPEFEHWQATADDVKSWKIKYYKGLGTSTSKEAKEYFSDMDRHRIPFTYEGRQDDQAIELAFSKKCVDERKEWLTNWLHHRRERRAEGLSESYLYGEKTESISYSDFINKELILFSNMDNERSIPNIVDGEDYDIILSVESASTGFKPGQRKVLFTCFKRNDKRDIKVAQLAGSVAEHSAYHHGEQSLMATIINLAQNFVGSNNINILQPIGQFGTRLHGGKDAASPRYIFTMLSPLARRLFSAYDDVILNSLYEDNQRIEPEWYCPIIPLVLVNGTEGIGTGYSTSVPNYNPREIVTNLKRMLNGLEPEGMKPWYKNFQGTIAPVEPHKYMVFGRIGLLSPTTIEITELPIRTWTQSYKENVLEALLCGNDKTPSFITDYKEYHTDVSVRFVVTLSPEKMQEAQAMGLHKKFKLVSNISTGNMILFDPDGCLKKYDGETDILKEFYETRLSLYHKRKEYLVGKLTAESLRLQNQARFILEKIEGKLVIDDKSKSALISELVSLKYDSDPVKLWKKSISDEVVEGEDDEPEIEHDYNYLLSMQLWSLTKEKKEELLETRDKKVQELEDLKSKTAKDLWLNDLDEFLTCLDEVEERERQEESAGAAITVKKKGKGKGRQTKLIGSSNDNSLSVTKPSPFAEVVNPEIPEFCATKVKKERVAKSRKAKTDDPSQNKLMFPSADSGTIDSGTEEIVASETAENKKSSEKAAPPLEVVTLEKEESPPSQDTTVKKKETIPVQTALNFPTESRKRARKTAKHDFSFSVEVNSVSSDDDDDDFSPQKITIARKKPQGKKQAVEEIPKPVSVTAVKSSNTLVKKAGKMTKTRKEITANKETKESVSSINKSITKGPTKKTKPFEVAVKRATKAKQTKRKVQDIEDIDDDSDKEVAIVEAPVARSKRPTKTIKYYFSSDEDDD